MSNKVVITSDITCDLNWELEQRYGVTCIPLHIVIGGKSYEDWVNIKHEELYEIFYKTKTDMKAITVKYNEPEGKKQKLAEDLAVIF